MQFRDQLRKLFLSLDLKISGKWFLLSAAIGIVAGLFRRKRTALHSTRRPLPPRVAGEKDSLVRPDATQFDKTPARLARQVNKILTLATLRTG